MAKWIISTSGRKLVITYVNLTTGAEFNCGECHPSTPVGMLLDWTCIHADAGDVITAPRNQILLVLPQGQA